MSIPPGSPNSLANETYRSPEWYTTRLACTDRPTLRSTWIFLEGWTEQQHAVSHMEDAASSGAMERIRLGNHAEECREGKVCKKHTPLCQVPGCGADLAAEGKHYCWHRHICNHHMKADVIHCPGSEPLRFCLQCGKLEPLAAFDGHNRSCRTKLRKRRERRNKAKPSAATKSKHTACSDATLPSTHADTAAATAAALPPEAYDWQPQKEEELEGDLDWLDALACSDTPAMMGAAERGPAELAELSQQQHELRSFAMPETGAGAEVEVHFAAERVASAPPAAAASQAAATPSPDEFELMLYRILGEELATQPVQEYACSRNSSRRSSATIDTYLNPACTAAGFACSSGLGHEGCQLPGLSPELHLTTQASFTGLCCSRSNSNMLAPAASLVTAPSTSGPGHMAGSFSLCPGAVNAIGDAPAATAAVASVVSNNVYTMGTLPVTAGVIPGVGQQYVDGGLTAMQERLAGLQAQLSVLLNAAGDQGAPQHLGLRGACSNPSGAAASFA